MRLLEPSEQQIHSIIQKAFPSSKIKKIERITKLPSLEGWDFRKSNIKSLDSSFPERGCVGTITGISNINYGVEIENPNQKILLRIKTKQSTEWKLICENTALKLLGESSVVPVPTPIKLDTSKSIIDNLYLIESWIGGENFDDILPRIHQNERISLSQEMGEYLANIHSIEFKHFSVIANEGDINRTFFLEKLKFNKWKDYILNLMDTKLKFCVENKLLEDDFATKIKSYIKNNSYLLDIKPKPVLVHRDYLPKNILIKYIGDKLKISGILDFEHSIAYHNEWDFVKPKWWLFEKYPETEEAFMNGYKRYGKLSEDFKDRLKIYELIESIIHLSYFIRIKQKDMFNECKGRINRIVKS